MATSAVQLFELLAESTWERILAGEELGCRQGEETLTNINLLDIKRARLHEVRVPKINKADEPKTGIDWEWWIGSNKKGWWRYAVQAKKIDSSGRYSKLRHKVRGRFQIDILEDYAKSHKCIPLYCFYNFIKANNLQDYWQCCVSYDKFQLGCTVASIDVAKKAFVEGKSKTFQFVHSQKQVLPWRCLVKCPSMLSLSRGEPHPLANGVSAEFSWYETLPFFLRKDAGEENIIEFPTDLYNRDLALYPKRILAIDVGDTEAGAE